MLADLRILYNDCREIGSRFLLTEISIDPPNLVEYTRCMMKKFFVPLLCLALFFVSCSNQELTPYLVFNEAAYNTAKEKWQNFNCTNYSFTYEINNDATGPNCSKVVMTVKDGISTYKVIADSQEDLDRFDEYDARFVSAEYLFDFIWEVYEDEKTFVEERPRGLVSETIDVKYDESSGFPISIEIYSSWSPEAAVDGNRWSFKIDDIKFSNL